MRQKGYYNCWICKKECECENENMILKDGNKNWFCPSCYKSHGKPNRDDIRSMIKEELGK